MDKPVMLTPETNLTKVPPRTAVRIKIELERKLRDRRPKAKRKFLETVDVDGCRYAVSCKETGEVVEVRQIRQLPSGGRGPRRGE